MESIYTAWHMHTACFQHFFLHTILTFKNCTFIFLQSRIDKQINLPRSFLLSVHYPDICNNYDCTRRTQTWSHHLLPARMCNSRQITSRRAEFELTVSHGRPPFPSNNLSCYIKCLPKLLIFKEHIPPLNSKTDFWRQEQYSIRKVISTVYLI